VSFGALQSTIISIKVSPRREMREAEICFMAMLSNKQKMVLYAHRLRAEIEF
jgi:hypothetical protein